MCVFIKASDHVSFFQFLRGKKEWWQNRCGEVDEFLEHGIVIDADVKMKVISLATVLISRSGPPPGMFHCFTPLKEPGSLFTIVGVRNKLMAGEMSTERSRQAGSLRPRVNESNR